jgi:hypothetical protein
VSSKANSKKSPGKITKKKATKEVHVVIPDEPIEFASVINRGRTKGRQVTKDRAKTANFSFDGIDKLDV